jgi:uncharacterized protein YqeY
MLIDTVYADMITARKGSDSVAKNLLVTLYSEAAMVGKNKRNGPTTDDEVIATVKKFTANAEETVRLLEQRGTDVAVQKHEITILNRYLPQQMTEADLTDAVKTIVSTLGVNGPKAMGAVMAELKAQYAGKYDGKIASAVVKSVLV